MDLEQNYINNMEFIKQGWSSVYKSIEKADISEYELVVTESGEYNIAKNGHNIYPEKVDASIESQVDTFLKKPPMFFKKPTWNQDSECDYSHDKLIKDIEVNSIYLKENKDFDNYHENLDGYFPFLLVMGIGAGFHIKKLIEKSKGIKEIIIVDENYEMLKISFHLTDWRPIFLYFKQKNHGLYFTIHEDSQETANVTMNTIYKYFSYQFYLIPFYTHYKSKFFDEFRSKFLAKINLGFSGQGFYDDEVISLNHTIRNLNDNVPIFRYSNKLPSNATAFVIASGPSIDKDIEYIKKHKDNVVIFSCGTALKILYKNDIVPDFHMEIERPIEMVEIIENYGSKEYLKKINMIGLSVIHPDVYAMFKSAKMFFRENDAGSSVVPEDIPKLKHCNPTIVNGTLSFLSQIGFKNIFMFGTDMGFKDVENHHSKDTIYYDSHKLENIPLNKDTYPGNFNKEERFLTTPTLEWCKQRAENCMADYNILQKKNINYFNCSNGLFIKATMPFHAEDIVIEKSLNKTRILSKLDAAFDSNFKRLHNQVETIYKKEKEQMFKNILEIENLIKEKRISSFESLFILIAQTFEIANNPDIKQQSFLTRSILKGTMYHFYTALYTHSLAAKNKEKAFEYINKSLEKLLKFLDEAKNTVENIKLK